MYIMATEPCPDMTAEDLRSKYADMASEKELADAYGIASNQFWWVEDDVYDYEEGTSEYEKALAISDAWKAVMEEYENKIFEILKTEGVTIPSSGRIKVLIPFMERNGYMDGAGWWIEDSKPEDYLKAHEFSNNHMKQLKEDRICGCFYCLRIFSPREINEWIIDDNPCDEYGTAICPYCGIDSVIGESSGFPITKTFLEGMQQHWFGNDTDANTHEEEL